MNFEKIGDSPEKTYGGGVETNSARLEKNIEVEKPDSVRAKESSENFMKNLEYHFSPKILEQINSEKELQIYEGAGLREENVNGKICLVRDDIDWDQKDSMGRTNLERAQQGLAPIKENKPIELHHVGQHSDSSLAELTNKEHHSGGNDTILHDKTKDSEIDRNSFAGEKAMYWKARAKEVEGI